MKKLFLTLLFCWAALCTQNVFAQYVTLPDTNFRNALKVKYPTCFNADLQLDTTCTLVLTDTLLNVSDKNISNLEGIAQGMYLLKVTQKGENRTAKVMVK